MANNNGHHSFYREQEKSILGQEKWTPKRIGKLLLTLSKWFLWGFLIVATLWGCVNEFIIQTSKNLGQGVEFYQADDFVYPNTYQAVNITGYTSSKVAVEEGKIDKDEDVKGLESFTNPPKNKNDKQYTQFKQTTPFNFTMVNPNFGIDDDDVPEYGNNTDLFVNAIEYAEAGGDVTPFYYNLNYFTYNLTLGAYGHDAADMTVDGTWMLPFTFGTNFKDWVNENKASDYEIENITDFYYYLLDASDTAIDNQVDASLANAENMNWDSDATGPYEVDDAQSINGTLVANTTSINDTNYSDIANWNVSKTLSTTYDDESTDDEVLEAIQNEIKQQTNLLAFNNGTGIASSSELLAKKTNDGSYLEQLYFEEYAEQTKDYRASRHIVDPEYTVNYNESFLNTGFEVYGGAQTIVIPIAKGFPVRIDEDTQKLVDSWRGENFQNWDTSKTKHQESGFDIENQMYGWTVLDWTTSTEENGYQATLMRVYDTAEDAETGAALTDQDEDNAFYADQRRLGWGAISDEEEASTSVGNGSFVNDNGSQYSVFDEKIKSLMTQEKYVRMSNETTINGKKVSYNYAAEFAGMESVNQAAFGFSGENPDYFYGTTPEIEQSNYKDQTLTQETSILSDSIIPTAQDAWGESRVTFIGWADWGKAWDVQYGPLYGAFVFPLAQLAMMIGSLFGYMASAWGVILSIVVIVFLTRGLGALLSLKGTSNQMKMQEVQTDVAKIKAKYAKYDLKAEPRYKQKQQMEIMALYRKKEINPMGSLGTIFITMPIFISLWIIISSLPAYKVVFMGNFSWAVSSFYGIFNMGWLFLLYLMVGVSVGLVQGISSKLPTWLSNKRKGIKRIDEATKEASRKQNKTQNIMIGVFVFMGLTVPALFAFYWICSGFFTIILELVKHSWKVHVAEEMKKDPTYKTPMARMFKKG